MTSIIIIRRICLFVVLCLAQALVLNHVRLFGCATPLLYVYFVLSFPHNISRSAALLWAFAMGLVTDIFTNTPGMAAASLTLLAAVQPSFFGLFLQHDAPDDVRPSHHTMGISQWAFYVGAMVMLHCLTFYTLEAFSFFNWQIWLKSIVGSWLITTILILSLESLRRK